jgi:hypothetical protein
VLFLSTATCGDLMIDVEELNALELAYRDDPDEVVFALIAEIRRLRRIIYRDTCGKGHSLDGVPARPTKSRGKIYMVRACPTCKRVRGKKWRAANVEKVRESNRKWMADKRNRDQVNQQRRRREQQPPSVADALDCGHPLRLVPPPQVEDIIWCNDCRNYRCATAVAKKAS